VNRRLLELLADKRVQRGALLVLLWVPALVVLLVVREVLMPFLLAFALAYVITPPVRWLSSRPLPGGRTLPRWASVISLYVVTAGLVWMGGRIFVPQLYKEVQRLGSESSALFEQLSDDNIAAKTAALGAWIEKNDLPIHIVTVEDEEDAAVDGAAPVNASGGVINVDVTGAVQDLIRKGKEFARDRALEAASQVQGAIAFTVRFVFSSFLVLMLTAFIVADTAKFGALLSTITPVGDRETLRDLARRIDRGLSGVVRGQLTICVINGVLTLIGLLLLKVKFAFLLATVAAVFSLIPIFGSILSTIPIVIVGLSSGPSTAVLAVLWIVGIHALEANFLNPKIMGDAAKIHPVLVVLALVIGEHYYGLTGALFAVPLMSALVTIWKAARQRAMKLDAEIHRGDIISETPEALSTWTLSTSTTAAATSTRRVRLRDGG
jgi:predicted PurR-regulated permease PerM